MQRLGRIRFMVAAGIAALLSVNFFILTAIEEWYATGLGITFTAILPDIAATQGITGRFVIYLLNHILVFILIAVLWGGTRASRVKIFTFVGPVLLAFLFLITLDAPFAYLARKYPKLFMFHPATVYRLTPGFHFRNDVSINSFGLRGGPITQKKPDGAMRIALVGDSALFGADMPQPLIVSTQMEKVLRVRIPDERFEVLNASVPGQSSTFAVHILQNFVLPLAPDVVIMGYNNDSTPASAEDRYYFDGRRRPGWLISLLDYLLLNYGNFLIMARDASIIEFRLAARGKSKVPRVSEGDAGKNVLDVAALCREAGSRLVVLGMPECTAEGRSFAVLEPGYRTAMENAARESGIPFFDVRKHWGTKNPALFQRDGYHLSIAGNARLARDLVAFLIENGIIGRHRQ